MSKSYKEYSWYNNHFFLRYRDEIIDELVELLGEEEVIQKIELEIDYIKNHPSNIGKILPSDVHINSFLYNVLRRKRKGWNSIWF